MRLISPDYRPFFSPQSSDALIQRWSNCNIPEGVTYQLQKRASATLTARS